MSDSLSGQTVLVTGATGFLGGALVHRLAAEGVQMRALARNPQRAGYIQHLEGVEIVQGDLQDASRMAELVQGCTVVFHVAAATGGPINHQRTINVEATRKLALAAAQAGVARIVYVSTIAVYGFRYQGTITEEMPPQPRHDPYNVTKAEAESALREVTASHGLAYSIIRPGMIYGPRSGVWTGQLFRLARLKPTPFLGPGSGSIQTIHVDDVVEQLYIQATHPNAVGETFNAAPDPPPTWRELLGTYASLAGHDSWLSLPPQLGTLVAPPLDGLLSLRGEPHDLPDLAAYIQRRTVYSMDKARRLLDWQPRVDLASGIASCVPWLREQGLLK